MSELRRYKATETGVAESRDESITESLEDSFKILQNHPVIQQRPETRGDLSNS